MAILSNNKWVWTAHEYILIGQDENVPKHKASEVLEQSSLNYEENNLSNFKMDLNNFLMTQRSLPALGS